MPSLMELVERVNGGESIDPEQLQIYQESPNAAERFLAHHSGAMIDLRRSHRHMLEALEAIDFADQKVLDQFVSVCSFLGLDEQRTGPMVRFGQSAIARRDFALGLEAVQHAVAGDVIRGGTWGSERSNLTQVAELYADAAAAIGWMPASALDWNNKQTKIAYVSSAIADDEAAGRAAAAFAKTIDIKRFKLSIYSTEAYCRRDKQQMANHAAGGVAASSSKRGQQLMEAIKNAKSSAWLSPVAGDLVTAAVALADQLVRDQTDVLILDADLADPIAGLLAFWETARVKVNLARRMPIYSAAFDCVAYLDSARCAADRDWWESREVECIELMEGIDVDAPMHEMPKRSTYGIPESSVILATAGVDLPRTINDAFIDAMIDTLKAHPQAVYLLIGGGDLTNVRRRFDNAGVGKRVGYTGRRKDLPGFLRIADLYVAEWPAADGYGVLQAMSVERPVVAMAWGEGPESVAAEYAGSEASIPGRDRGAFLDRVGKLVRDRAYRVKMGRTMRRRLEEHFAYNQTARGIEQLCDRLIARKSEAVGDKVTMVEEEAQRQAA